MVSPLFRVMMLTFVQGLSVTRSERASESSEAENERDLFFFCERDNRRIQKDPHTSNTHPDASSLDKENDWEFAYLLHVTCAHLSVGPHAWAAHVSDRTVGVKRLIIIVH